MIFAGSVVSVEPENLEAAKAVIGLFSQVDIHAVSDDNRQIVVSIEAESDTDLESICAGLKEHDEIIDVSHHIFNFEDEVEEILAGEKVPSLRGFFKSERKRDNN